MPKIRRWFPVSQDINADPEVWELTDKFGDRAIRVWLEILSIADRNEGQLPGHWETYPKVLAARCRSTPRHLEGVLKWVSRWLQIDSEGVARVSNYWKYHRGEERKRFPSEPSYPNHPNHPPIPPASLTDGFSRFWLHYPRKVGKGAAEKAWKAIKPDTDLTNRILASVEVQKTWPAWTKENGQFIPHPATWLHQKRWEDEPDIKPAVKLVQKPDPPPPEMTPEQIAKSKEFIQSLVRSL